MAKSKMYYVRKAHITGRQTERFNTISNLEGYILERIEKDSAGTLMLAINDPHIENPLALIWKYTHLHPIRTDQNQDVSDYDLIGKKLNRVTHIFTGDAAAWSLLEFIDPNGNGENQEPMYALLTVYPRTNFESPNRMGMSIEEQVAETIAEGFTLILSKKELGWEAKIREIPGVEVVLKTAKDAVRVLFDSALPSRLAEMLERGEVIPPPMFKYPKQK
jgi:hypothetical protein